MGRQFVTKGNRFYCISLQPDICKTPNGPSTPAIPYTIKGEFAEATGVSTNITSNQESVVLHANTVIPTVTGDEKGTAKGVKSQTVGKRVQHDQKSSTVSFNGERAIRVGDTVFMNDKNTIGKVYERSSAAAEIAPAQGASALKPIDGQSSVGLFEARFNRIFTLLSDPSALATRASFAAASGAFPFPHRGQSPLMRDNRSLHASNGPPGEQPSGSNLAGLKSHLAIIPPALLNKLPGGTATCALLKTLAQSQELPEREKTGSTQQTLNEVPAKVHSPGGGTDGGASRGMNVRIPSKGSVPNPPPPKVTAAGGDPGIVNKELAKLPESVLSALSNGNIKIITVRDTIVEVFPELQNVVPRGWGGTGKTWNDVPGVFMPERGVVAIATSDRYATGSGNTILHEIGHAYDHTMGALSQSPSFSSAYDADKGHYSAYYLQAGVAGREEAFAESFANYYSKNYSYFTEKPGVLEYWKNLPPSMQTSRTPK